MPRKRRTLPVAAPQDQGYGTRGEQMAAQHAVPLPDNRAPASVTPISAAPSAAPSAPQGDMSQALATAAAMTPSQGSLNMPTQRPTEPITAGLTTGPGVGPSTTHGADPVLDALRGMLIALDGGAGSDQILALIEAAQNP